MNCPPNDLNTDDAPFCLNPLCDILRFVAAVVVVEFYGNHND